MENRGAEWTLEYVRCFVSVIQYNIHTLDYGVLRRTIVCGPRNEKETDKRATGKRGSTEM